MLQMDSHVFQEQMERLADLFGAKHYNQDRLKLIWQEVNHLSNNWMVRTTDLFIGNLRVAPLIPEFREEISKERERLWQIQKKQPMTLAPNLQTWFCSDCSNTGLIFSPENSVYKCACAHGRKRPESYPIFLRSGLRAI